MMSALIVAKLVIRTVDGTIILVLLETLWTWFEEMYKLWGRYFYDSLRLNSSFILLKFQKIYTEWFIIKKKGKIQQRYIFLPNEAKLASEIEVFLQ